MRWSDVPYRAYIQQTGEPLRIAAFFAVLFFISQPQALSPMGSRLPIEITSATPAAMATLWEALCVDPQLADLPYKVETNERGQLLMSPAGTSHSRWQARVTRTLGSIVDAAGLGGEVLTECAVLTALGIKVPDVAWISDPSWSGRTNQSLLMVAPEICIDVMSPSNTAAEMADKAALYSASGASEVWILDASGRMQFFQSQGALVASNIMPSFPIVLALA